MWFLFREVSSSSGCLGWAALFYCGTPWAFHIIILGSLNWFEPRYEKTGILGFRPGPTQTRLYSHKRWLEACIFVFRKERDCTIYVAKTKALISFAVTAKLICVFVFAYTKSRFSHDAARLTSPSSFYHGSKR